MSINNNDNEKKLMDTPHTTHSSSFLFPHITKPDRSNKKDFLAFIPKIKLQLASFFFVMTMIWSFMINWYHIESFKKKLLHLVYKKKKHIGQVYEINFFFDYNNNIDNNNNYINNNNNKAKSWWKKNENLWPKTIRMWIWI